MEIRKINTDQWMIFKEVRLCMLDEENIDFDYSADEISGLSEKDWREKIEGENKITLIAFDNGKAIGTVRAYVEKGERKNHIAVIRGLYVRKKFKENGIGRKLMVSILDEIKKMQNILKIKLEVAANLETAINLYKSTGFEIVGTLKKELNSGDNIFVDKYIMELFV